MPVSSRLNYSASQADNYLRPPIILIHGAGGHHLYWPPQVRRLHGQRVFALDLPGHGDSSGIAHSRVEDYTDAVVAFMRELRLNSAVLVGHSLGGAIAIDAALRHSRQVLGLGLVGTGARLGVDAALLRSASQDDTFHTTISLLGKRSFGAGAPPRLKELALKRMSEMRSAVLFDDLTACNEFDRMDQLGQINVRTIILCGAEDQMTPVAYSRYLNERIAGSTFQVFPDAGHMLMLERPAEVADVLGQFLDSIPYTPGR